MSVLISQLQYYGDIDPECLNLSNMLIVYVSEKSPSDLKVPGSDYE